MISVSQDPNAHLFYEVDWSDWLKSRGYTADQITSVEFRPTPAAYAEITHTSVVGAKASVWIKDVQLGQKVKITATIKMPAPASDAPAVQDEYSFQLFGKQN